MISWLTSLPHCIRLLWLTRQRRCILITRHGGIGDVLCSLPAVEALNRQHPGLPVVFVTSKDYAKMVELSGVVDLVVPNRTRGLSWLQRNWLRPAVQAVLELPDERKPPMPCSRRHLSVEFASQLDVTVAQTHPQFEPAPSDLQKVAALLEHDGLTGKQMIIIHTGPTWPVREWSQQHWEALVSEFQKQGLTPLQIGSSKANAHGVNSPPTSIPGSLDWRDRLSLTELFALIKSASLFIGIDSGPLHLAAIAGSPMIGIFGPVAPECRMPARDNAIGLAAKIPCIACHHDANGPAHWQTGCPQDIECMKALSPVTVLEAALSLLPTAHPSLKP